MLVCFIFKGYITSPVVSINIMLYFTLQTNLANIHMFTCLLAEVLLFLMYQWSDYHGISRIVFLTISL